MINTHKKISKLGIFLIYLISINPLAVSAQMIDNDANALMLANQAKSNVQSSSRNGIQDQKSRLRDSRGSSISNLPTETECGGISIGNIHPSGNEHNSHKTTVIIRGNVVNTGNRC